VKEQKYECLNLKCKYVGNGLNEIKTGDNSNNGTKNQNNRPINSPIPNWLKALLLIFTLSFIGLVINTFVGSIIPFWLLFGFSFSYSVEKWFSFYTRKHKWLGRLYRLILNLGILSLFVLLIWSGTKLFSHQFVQSSLIGSILFLVEFFFFIWVWRTVSKNSWRWPSMKLTIFTLICLFLVFAFAGVQPISSYKDTALNKIQIALSNKNNNKPITTYSNNITSTPIAIVSTASATIIAHTNVITTSGQTNTTTQIVAQGINSRTGIYKNYYLGVVNSTEGVLSGDGCYDDSGNFIILINNKNAADPTYSQLLNFLQNNKTDQYPYILTSRPLGSYYGTAESHVDLKNIQNIIDGTTNPGNPDVCADFAERLHNDAEMAGIRCAYVSMELSVGGHACNAFQTTDRGLIYVDDTGPSQEPHPLRSVKTVNQIVVGRPYIPIAIFPETGWSQVYQSVGTVTNMEIFWDGRWNN